MDCKELLEEFLSYPIDDASAIFEKFASLPHAIYARGSESLQQFVYVPGVRKDRIVLVAHADTVWDIAYGNPQKQDILYKDGVFSSSKTECGIGADDRAGCAMVWALRHSGHSLLILNGEEKGKVGAKYLRDCYPAIYKELNSHCYMIEFDWAGRGACLFNQVDNTESFKKFVAEDIGFLDSQKKGGCDLQILCKKVCGVNLSVGWRNWHRHTESLHVSDWEDTYNRISAFLMKPQTRYAIPKRIIFAKFLARVRGKIGNLVRCAYHKKSS